MTPPHIRGVLARLGRSVADERPLVRESWLRCAGQGVDPDAPPPVLLTDAELEDYRAAHPLVAAMPVIRRLLVEDAADCDMVVAVCDAVGRLLWVEGASGLRARAEHMSFVEGAQWSESVAGTNAPGTALTLGRPVQIHRTEHYNSLVEPWSCSAAPIHDPGGALVGAVDITGGDDVALPHVLRLVAATAAAAEAELRLSALTGRATRPTSRLRVLGRSVADLAAADGTRVPLRPRHAEILVLLAEHPQGLRAEQLDALLAEDDRHALVSTRAEIHRLRGVLAAVHGPAIASRPYRLDGDLTTDIAAVRAALAAADPRAALDAYSGPVLATSRAPGVERVRHRLADQVRTAVIRSGDPALIAALAHRPEHEDDHDLWRACAGAQPPGSAGALAAVRHLARLDAEYGSSASATLRQPSRS